MKMEPLEHLKRFLLKQDNNQNFVNQSSVPERCRSDPCMVGVDEAGRGPVLGPMVYGVAYCPISETRVLKNLGCADSKALTEEKRDEIYCKMETEVEATSSLGWFTEVISPNYISNSMYRRARHSLNEVSMNSAISLIKKIAESGVNIAEVYVDTVGPPEKYQAKLAEIFPDYKITVSKKADSLYPIVSAASIIAKVTRDHALKVWRFKEGFELKQEFGSGYPGDPLTKKFISNQVDYIFGYPTLVRFSWSTSENMLKGKAAKCTFEDIDEEIPKSKKAVAAMGTKKLNSFFGTKTEAKKFRPKHKFFEERFLSLTNAFE